MLTNASKNQDAWGGSGCWFMWVILLFWLWGGNGYGNGFGRGTAVVFLINLTMTLVEKYCYKLLMVMARL